jgi:hypothetical protein
MYGYTGYNCSHWNGNGKLKEKSVICTEKTLDIFTTADSCIGSITQYGKCCGVELECEWWWVPGRKGL